MNQVPYPVRSIGRFAEIAIVPPPPRTDWGLSEAELLEGCCTSGCTSPVAVVEPEPLCAACADVMGVSRG